MTDALNRRDLLKQALAAGAGLATSGVLHPVPALAESMDAIRTSGDAPARPGQAATMRAVPFDRHETVRIGIVGTGLRGRSMLSELLAIDHVRIVALADIVPEKAARAVKMCTDAGQPAPALYTNGDHDFERLVARDDIDLVYTATPWEWHVPVMLAALASEKHCGTECPAGITLKDLWALVDASEKARRHCMQLENCNYGYNEMLVNRLVHDGVFGEIQSGSAAYIHDLRTILFENRDEGLWRRAWHTRVNGNLYPTHGLGPVAWYMDVHAGDRFDYMVSMSTEERGLTLHREATVPDRSDPKWSERYITGDLNSSLIRTARGRTILLQHDVSSPRPYTRLNGVAGTKGVFEDYPPRIYVEGQEGGHRFTDIDKWKASHEHPLWSRIGELARKKGGHGGMDFVMAWRLVECMREGLAPDFDVYDAAAWSAPLPLSQMSVAQGSAPMRFPDFTRGEWMKAR
ncbi:MAG TPA: Gfo/Idh/MocA family oxidoreductase [Gemmatimonadaceae bacterium]|nr:Gfo/Idh/MocA family oxidoreductase [Gemmatimonadaceae bacterium]